MKESFNEMCNCKIYNRSSDNEDWLDMNNQPNFNDRNKFVHISDVAKLRVGKNLMTNPKQ